MAISKMEKLTLISFKRNEEWLLGLMQDLQNVEIVNSIKELTSSEKKQFGALRQNLSPENAERVESLDKELNRVRQNINFLIDHSTGKSSVMFSDKKTWKEFEEIQDSAIVAKAFKKVEGLQHQLTEIDKQRNNLENAEASLMKWQYLEGNPNEFENSEFVSHQMGSLSLAVKDDFLQTCAIQFSSMALEVVYESQSRMYFSVVYLRELEEKVSKLLRTYSFSQETYAYDEPPILAYEKIREELAATTLERKIYITEIKKCQEELLLLQKTEEVVLAQIERAQATTNLAAYREFIIIRGWIEEKRKPQFTKLVEQASTEENPLILNYEEPQKNDDVPTLLRNNRLVRPFESLVEMYSLPKYGELDPTPLLMPFYLVFFGMMVADVGYGLLMLVGTTVAKRLMPLRKSTAGFMDFFQILSVPVMIWGFIYGSFFGVSLPFQLLSTTKDMNTILLLSVIFGFIQLLVGLMVNGLQLVKKKEYLASISDGFAWQGILLSVAMLVLGKMLLKSTLIFNVGLIIFGVCAFLIIFIPVITSQSKGKGLAKGLYAFYGITGYIGDLVSYTRLMALGISGGSIAAAFNMLVSFMPPVAKFTVGIVLIVILHALNIFLSLLGAYVHGARLQYVEYFGKFFAGGGRKFSPLKPKEKYVDFKVKNDE